MIVVVSCVSINENTSLTGISVFPNPANNVININLGEANATFNFALTSIDGKVVYFANTITNKNMLLQALFFSICFIFLLCENV